MMKTKVKGGLQPEHKKKGRCDDNCSPSKDQCIIMISSYTSTFAPQLGIPLVDLQHKRLEVASWWLKKLNPNNSHIYIRIREKDGWIGNCFADSRCAKCAEWQFENSKFLSKRMGDVTVARTVFLKGRSRVPSTAYRIDMWMCFVIIIISGHRFLTWFSENFYIYK